MMIPGTRIPVSRAKIGSARNLMSACPATVAAAPTQLPVRKFQRVAPVEAVVEDSNPATPNAMSAVFISV